MIIAEDITSRFLNVISLFNGFIPLIAIQVKAVKIDDTISLFFTKVLDENKFDILEEESASEPTDKEYWEKKATKESVKLTEKLMSSLHEITSEYSLKYNKHYIGIAKNNVANNFLSFVPRKSAVILHFKLEKTDEIDEIIEKSDLDSLAYDKQWNQYRLRIREDDLKNSLEVIEDLAARAKSAYMS